MVEISYGGGTTATLAAARQVETKEYNTGKTTNGTEPGFSIVRHLYDALDRLVEVKEVLNGAEVVTARYRYDPMGNLIEVVQGTQPARTFAYRSSSRLETATNPESGTMTYAYERDGSMKSKSDAVANPRVSYFYDSLGRLTSKAFSGGETAVTQSYWLAADAGALGKIGRLKRVARTGIGWTEYAEYDALGRVLTLNQSISGAPLAQYGLQYQYFANGAVKQMTYPAPSNRVVNYELDTIGRTVRVCAATCTPTSKYAEIAGAAANETGYAPHGAIARLTLGNGVVETSGYNPYLQLQQFSALGGSASLQITLGYGTAGKNNGNILSQRIVSGGLDVTTQYDYTERNQIKKGEEKPTGGSAVNWSRSFDYDLFGNMWVTAMTPSDPDATIPRAQGWFNPANNQLMPTYAGYNPIGEMTSQGGWSYGYSAEGEMVTATVSGATRTNSYDGLGRRVKVSDSVGTTYFVYGADGELVAEHGAMAAGGNGREYVTSDWLGSTRMVTDSTGALKARRDYLPFGQFVDATIGGRGAMYSASGPRQMFTGRERDGETGLDYFGARYMSAAQGRFTSPDPLLQSGRPGNPQTWNRYAYVINNPLGYIDPDGQAELPAKYRDMVVKYAPTAGAVLTRANRAVEGLNQISHFERSMGFLPPITLGGPTTSASELAQAKAVSKLTNSDIIMVDNPKNQGLMASVSTVAFTNPLERRRSN